MCHFFFARTFAHLFFWAAAIFAFTAGLWVRDLVIKASAASRPVRPLLVPWPMSKLLIVCRCEIRSSTAANILAVVTLIPPFERSDWTRLRAQRAKPLDTMAITRTPASSNSSVVLIVRRLRFPFHKRDLTLLERFTCGRRTQYRWTLIVFPSGRVRTAKNDN